MGDSLGRTTATSYLRGLRIQIRRLRPTKTCPHRRRSRIQRQAHAIHEHLRGTEKCLTEIPDAAQRQGSRRDHGSVFQKPVRSRKSVIFDILKILKILTIL